MREKERERERWNLERGGGRREGFFNQSKEISLQ